jgi:hypothetical protein
MNKNNTTSRALYHVLYERHNTEHGECYARLVAAGKKEDLEKLMKVVEPSLGALSITEVEDPTALHTSLEKTITEHDFKSLMAPSLYPKGKPTFKTTAFPKTSTPNLGAGGIN